MSTLNKQKNVMLYGVLAVKISGKDEIQLQQQ